MPHPSPTHPAPTYDEAIQNLSALIPELFTTPGQPRRKFSLDQIGTLSAALGNPHRQFPAILIAGTNGKGSTAATLASIAQASGIKTGLYTSPHLARVNERIKLLLPNPCAPDGIDGTDRSDGTDGPNGMEGAPGLDLETWVPNPDIPDQDFARLYFQVHDTAQQLVQTQELPTLPSYFELLTALAFLYFAEQKVDLAILEVGMGGRLDATNLVDPILAVITDIALDHQEWLGSTIAEITREKAGILRPDGTLITLPQHPAANQALGEAAVPLNVRAISAAVYMPAHHAQTGSYPIELMSQQIQIDSPLKGAHQHRNIALAIAAAVELAENHNFPITPQSIEKGIRQTRWPGRLETLPVGNQEFLLDVAHNPAGAWALRAALSNLDTNAGAPSFAYFAKGGSDKSTTQSPTSDAPHLATEMWESPPTSKPDAPSFAPFAKGGTPQSKTNPPHTQCLIFACLRDKPLREMTQILFPIFDHILLAPIHSPRANEVADLLAAAQATDVPSTPTQSVAEAIQIARTLPVQRVVISGSVYLVGEARTQLLALQSHPPPPQLRPGL